MSHTVTLLLTPATMSAHDLSIPDLLHLLNEKLDLESAKLRKTPSLPRCLLPYWDQK